MPVPIPPSAPTGTYTLLVADAATMDAVEQRETRQRFAARDLDDLLALARQAIARRLGLPEPPLPEPPASPTEPSPTFVTLMKRGQLRGCIGCLEPRRSLPEDVATNAQAADPDGKPHHEARGHPQVLRQEPLRHDDGDGKR